MYIILAGKMLSLFLIFFYGTSIFIRAWYKDKRGFSVLDSYMFAVGMTGFITLQWITL